VLSSRAGRVRAIDNRRLARVAKLAGAPGAPAAGVDGRCRVGDRIARGQPLFEVHAQSAGEAAYALAYARAHPEIIAWEDEP
jgi:thymidine phosphorylase